MLDMASHLMNQPLRLDSIHLPVGYQRCVNDAMFDMASTLIKRPLRLDSVHLAVGYGGCENGHSSIIEGRVQNTDNKFSRGSYMHVWTLCKQKQLKEAVDTLLHMYQQGLELESDSVAEVLLLCTSMRALAEGKKLHLLLKNKGVRSNSYLQNNLLNMYTKCGSLVEGREVFEEMPVRDVVSWNAMITGYAKSGNNGAALKMFWQMQQESVEPNKTTFVCVLKACAPPAYLDDGAQIHTHVINCGLEQDVFVGSALVEMYAKFGSLHNARRVFEKMTVRDVVSWTSMIAGYSECGYGEEALQLFQQMLQEGVKPDKVIFFSVLSACASPTALEQGHRIHSHIIDTGFELDAFVGSALVDMYAKCGCLQLACHVFEQLPVKDVVSWTSLISGYEQQGEGKEALKIFHEMEAAGVKPNEVTFVSALNACSPLAVLELGISVHANIINYGYESNVYVASALVDMYAKCGSAEDACLVFHKLSNRDTVAWNTMIDGQAQHGNPKAALQLFDQMKQEGVKADGMTFVGVLSACNHAGLVDEGWHYFDSMQCEHGISPSLEHYACMVDILGRAGHLEAATNFLQKLPAEPGLSVWTAVLSACRIHGNVDMAKNAVESIIKLEPQKESAYVLLSNIYAVAGGKERK